MHIGYFISVMQMHYQKSSKSSKSDQIPISPLSRTSFTAENVTTNKLHGGLPVEVTAAAAAAVKKRGPPPKPPAPYRKSHTLDSAKQHSSGKSNNGCLESTTSIESSSQEAQISPKVVKAVKLKKISRPASDPLPRKKYNLFRKPKPN